jgi:hypothetical protein
MRQAYQPMLTMAGKSKHKSLDLNCIRGILEYEDYDRSPGLTKRRGKAENPEKSKQHLLILKHFL